MIAMSFHDIANGEDATQQEIGNYMLYRAILLCVQHFAVYEAWYTLSCQPNATQQDVCRCPSVSVVLKMHTDQENPIEVDC